MKFTTRILSVFILLMMSNCSPVYADGDTILPKRYDNIKITSPDDDNTISFIAPQREMVLELDTTPIKEAMRDINSAAYSIKANDERMQEMLTVIKNSQTRGLEFFGGALKFAAALIAIAGLLALLVLYIRNKLNSTLQAYVIISEDLQKSIMTIRDEFQKHRKLIHQKETCSGCVDNARKAQELTALVEELKESIQVYESDLEIEQENKREE